jgi:hypothetical protein
MNSGRERLLWLLRIDVTTLFSTHFTTTPNITLTNKKSAIYHKYEASPTIIDVVVAPYSNHSNIELLMVVKKYWKYGIFTDAIRNDRV